MLLVFLIVPSAFASSSTPVSTLKLYSEIAYTYERLYVIGVGLVNIGREIEFINEMSIAGMDEDIIYNHRTACIEYFNAVTDAGKEIDDTKSKLISKATAKKINIKNINTIMSNYSEAVESCRSALDYMSDREFEESLEINAEGAEISYEYANESFERYSYFMNLIQK